jgi:hypothetical protein
MADPGQRQRVASRGGGTQLARQDPRSGKAEATGRPGDQQVEKIFLQPVKVELPRDGPGAGGQLP